MPDGSETNSSICDDGEAATAGVGEGWGWANVCGGGAALVRLKGLDPL